MCCECESGREVFEYVLVGCTVVATMLWRFLKHKGLTEEFKEWLKTVDREDAFANTVADLADFLSKH